VTVIIGDALVIAAGLPLLGLRFGQRARRPFPWRRGRSRGLRGRSRRARSSRRCLWSVSSTPDRRPNILRAFRQDLREAGYVEGENITIEYRWADNQIDRLLALASDLFRQRVAEAVWPLELGDRGRAPPDGLTDLEAFELRMVDVERLVLARIPMGGAEFG
jgi:hypothetical protein